MVDKEKVVTGGYRRERKTERLNIRMSDSELAQLNTISYEDDESISQVIRKAIKTYATERAKNRQGV